MDRPTLPARSVGTTVQRVVHRRENLIDGDLAVVVCIAGPAAICARIAERSVDQCEEFIDRYLTVGVAVADADLRRRCGHHRGRDRQRCRARCRRGRC